MRGGERKESGGRRERTGSGLPIVRSVERAASIMQSLLSAGPRGRRVSELSAELDLHKTTAVRLLRTLVAVGWVRKDEVTGRYCCEPMTWLSFVGNLREAMGERDVLERVLRELVEATGMTVVLGKLDVQARSMRLVVRVLPDDPMQVDPAGISSAPMHAVAGGKTYLASLPERELEEWMKQGLPSITGRTITSPEVLRQELAQVRERGYAVAPGEFYPDAGSVAVAVLDETGRVVAGLDLVGPTRRMTPGNIGRWVSLLGETSEKVSRLLYSGMREAARG